MTTYHFKYVILGGGIVAGYAAQEFVAQGLKADELAIVTADNLPPYERPPLSKGFLMGEEALSEALINSPDFYKEHGIEVLLNSRIERVDFDAQRLFAETGDQIDYDKLLIATGAKPRHLSLPGADLDGVLYLRQASDARQIRQLTKKAEQAGVIGGGYIGMEVASALTQEDVDVTMVYPENHLLQRLFTPQMSAFFESYYRQKGVNLRPNSELHSLVGEGRVSRVLLADGTAFPVDFVTAGIGVEPRVDLFEDTTLDIDNGIRVNAYLESNVRNVFAAGDVANYYDILFEKRRRAEHWSNAAEQGKHAARVMMEDIQPFKALPFFFSDMFDLSWEFWGEIDNAEHVIYRGELENGSFSTYWIRRNRVVGAFAMNRSEDETEAAQKLIREAQPISVHKLRHADGLLEAAV